MNTGASRLGLQKITSFFLALRKQALETKQLNHLYEKQLRDLKAQYWNIALELYLSHLRRRQLQQELQSATTMAWGLSETVDDVGDDDNDDKMEICILDHVAEGNGRHNAGREMQCDRARS